MIMMSIVMIMMEVMMSIMIDNVHSDYDDWIPVEVTNAKHCEDKNSRKAAVLLETIIISIKSSGQQQI